FRMVSFPDKTLSEDVLFSYQLRQRGSHFTWDPKIEVLHHNRQGWTEFFAYNFKMGRAAAGYHREMQLWWAVTVLGMRILTIASPAVVLPSIALKLSRSRWSYLATFLLLSPMCLLGNIAWAWGFRKQAVEDKHAAAQSAVQERKVWINSK